MREWAAADSVASGLEAGLQDELALSLADSLAIRRFLMLTLPDGWAEAWLRSYGAIGSLLLFAGLFVVAIYAWGGLWKRRRLRGVLVLGGTVYLAHALWTAVPSGAWQLLIRSREWSQNPVDTATKIIGSVGVVVTLFYGARAFANQIRNQRSASEEANRRDFLSFLTVSIEGLAGADSMGRHATVLVLQEALEGFPAKRQAIVTILSTFVIERSRKEGMAGGTIDARAKALDGARDAETETSQSSDPLVQMHLVVRELSRSLSAEDPPMDRVSAPPYPPDLQAALGLLVKYNPWPRSRLDLRNADLRGANLRGANLRGALLYQARLDLADLADADLRQSDLRFSTLRRTLLRRARLDRPTPTGMAPGIWLKNRFYGRKWIWSSESIMERTDLPNVDLTNADLQGAFLQGADMRLVDLRGADLRGVHLDFADLAWAKVNEHTLLERADVRGANLSGVDQLSQRHVDESLGSHETELPTRTPPLKPPSTWRTV